MRLFRTREPHAQLIRTYAWDGQSYTLIQQSTARSDADARQQAIKAGSAFFIQNLNSLEASDCNVFVIDEEMRHVVTVSSNEFNLARFETERSCQGEYELRAAA